jgi:Sel1 repeat
MVEDWADLIATRVRQSANSRVAQLARLLASGWSLEAFDELKGLARRGDSAAQYWLARQYQIVPAVASLTDAVQWYRAAADQGQRAAELRGWRIATTAPATIHATQLAMEAKAKSGDADAEAWMGDFCRWGLNGEPDAAAATRWYRRAAGQNHPGALTLLGALLECAPNPSDETRIEALSFWLRAGMAGDPLAQYYVGLHYRDGAGCEPNPPRAARWLRAAAAQGHSRAEEAVRQLESCGVVCANPNVAAVELHVAGRGHECLREGWGMLGIEDTWTVGSRATVRLPVVTRGIDQCLKLEVGGIFPPWGQGMQRIVARVGELKVGEVVCRGAAVFEFFVPSCIGAAAQQVDIALELPDAQSPADHGEGDLRFLALRVSLIELSPVTEADRGRSPLTPEALERREALMHMQSLGINCEFGFLQRACGAEPLGLFRWTFAPLAKLVTALEQEFSGLTNRNLPIVKMNDDSEFVIEDPVYGFRHHTFLFASNGATLAMVKRGELLRVAMLTESLLEEIREQRKLFVYHDANQSSLTEVRRLLAALNRSGPNTLLWMVGPKPNARVGEVRWLEPGLIEGIVSGFQPSVDNIVPNSVHRPSWLTVACSAYRLWREHLATHGTANSPLSAPPV